MGSLKDKLETFLAVLLWGGLEFSLSTFFGLLSWLNDMRHSLVD